MLALLSPEEAAVHYSPSCSCVAVVDPMQTLAVCAPLPEYKRSIALINITLQITRPFVLPVKATAFGPNQFKRLA